jgi:colanic acid/amylovoran biosynthesis glycosyltransferase
VVGDQRPTVVVYTHSLLGPSMTFIRSHAESLRRYQPVYAGSRRVPGLALPEGRAHTANSGGLPGLVREFMFRRLGMAGGLAAQLRRFEPRVVHAHFGQSGPAALDLAEALGIPLIVTYHGQDATISKGQARKSWRGREYLRGRERVISRSRIIIAVSDFIREQLLEQGYPPEKVIMHRNGIDIDFFRPAIGTREATAIFVGRFVEKKGAEYFIRALGDLRQKGTELRGVLVGDGPMRAELERLARDVGANAEFPGFLHLMEVRKRLSQACVAVVPSVTAVDGNREGLPTVILEAQAMATPVVATRHAGNAEGLCEGKTALLVDERDVAGLADAIRFFVEDPAASRQYGESGRKFVETNFSIGSQVSGLERIYDRARGAA